MQILVRSSSNERPHVSVLFGLGMIGTAIRESLMRLQFTPVVRTPVDWNRAGGLSEVVKLIRSHCQGLRPSPRWLSIAWSAGASNFFSSAKDVEAENRLFEQVVRLAGELNAGLEDTAIRFHYLSSAGGLFEGQRVVDGHSEPTPQRPYGRMKCWQETLTRSSFEHGEFTIYRPSSVYGPIRRPRRHGLINQVIANASNRRISILDANVMALRDYVYAGDIGAYVARQIAFPKSAISQEEHFLVSGRCASIFEVTTQIERALKLRVRYRFDENFGNSASITFSSRVLPVAWHPSTLEVGIRQFMLLDRPQTRAISIASG